MMFCRALLSVVALLALLHLPAAAQPGTAPGAAHPSSQTLPVPPAFADRAASGEALVNAWFGLLALEPVDAGADNSPREVTAEQAIIRAYLDPAFQIQRASGVRYNVNDYVPVDITTFTVSGVLTTEPAEGVKVVRYTVSTPGATIPDRGWFLSGDARFRLNVFRWSAERGHWVMVSIANFNTPTAAICNAVPVPWTAMPASTSAEDAELGRSLLDQWRAATTGRPSEAIVSRQLMIQLADGQGWPNQAGTPITWSPAQSYEAADIVTSRHGDVLVVSFVAVVSGLRMEGRAYGSERQPRLLTYLRNADGKWELIALANFVTPATIPDGMDCVTKTP
jgi:hypothetical protein